MRPANLIAMLGPLPLVASRQRTLVEGGYLRTGFGHIVFGVKTENLPFYKDLMAFLGWNTIFAMDEGFGVVNSEL